MNTNPTFNPTKPVICRYGGKAEILCTNLKHPDFPIGAKITLLNGMEVVRPYPTNGKFGLIELSHNYDLINIPEPKKLHPWKSLDEIPQGPGVWFRVIGRNVWIKLTGFSSDGELRICDQWFHEFQLEYTPDNGKTILPCGVME